MTARRIPSASERKTLFKSRGLEPLVPFPGVDKPWRSRCMKCNEEVHPQFSQINRGQGANCACRKFRPVGSEEALKDMIHAGFTPLVEYPGNPDRAWPCIHTKCGRSVKPSRSGIRRGQGCAYCSGSRVDLNQAYDRLLDAALEPLAWFPGADKPWRCRCLKCGEEVEPSWSSVKRGQRGRCACARSGFDPKKAAALYLIENVAHGALKIGITNKPKSRLREHQIAGWRMLRQWELPVGRVARDSELRILSWWRHELRLPWCDALAEDMPQRGWTETVRLTDLLAKGHNATTVEDRIESELIAVAADHRRRDVAQRRDAPHPDRRS